MQRQVVVEQPAKATIANNHVGIYINENLRRTQTFAFSCKVVMLTLEYKSNAIAIPTLTFK